MAVFRPTGTTDVLIKAVKPYIKGGKLLDLGCGCGIVGGELANQVDEVFASDISPEATECAVSKYPVLQVRCGNLLEVWGDMKFDYIVSDVSGVAEDIAKASPWFIGVPCGTGKGGGGLIGNVLIDAHKYLNSGGKLFFPVVSLSNVNGILVQARQYFNIKLLSHTEFPLPREMYAIRELRELMRVLKKRGIQFEEKYGMIIFYTDIYMGVGK